VCSKPAIIAGPETTGTAIAGTVSKVERLPLIIV
jgi:adenine/guanine phosphoribosyltransferase-like PRPP-binding protein